MLFLLLDGLYCPLHIFTITLSKQNYKIEHYEPIQLFYMYLRMNEVKKFVEDVREEERKKQEEREMEEKRAIACLKIQVRV